MSKGICEKGHKGKAGDRCDTELRDKGGYKFRTLKECGEPFVVAPALPRCLCARGLYVDGACSFCGHAMAPDVWPEQGNGYSYKGNDPLLPKLIEEGLTAAETAELEPQVGV